MVKTSIVITGSNGFIGCHLTKYLSEKGYKVIAIIRKNSIPTFKLNENITCVYADLTDIESLKKAILKGSIVVNLAANPYDPKLSYDVNVGGIKNLIEVCRLKNVLKFIQISSQATKIKSKGVYAKTKIIADEILKGSGLPFNILKPSLVYGSGNKGLFNKIRSLVLKMPIIPIFGDGLSKVNPLYVLDLCKYIEFVLNDIKNIGTIYDIGSTKAVTYNNLYAGIVKNIDIKIFFVHIPVWFGLLTGNLFKILKLKNPPFYVDNILGSTQKINCNPGLIIKRYKYKPIEFKYGLDLMFHEKKTRVAVVGLGKMGILHLSILSSMDDVEIVALVDSNKKLFSTIKSMGVAGNFYKTIDEALSNEKFDAVFVLTPTFTHVPLIKRLMKENLNIFVEKPMSLNMDEANSLKEMSKNYKGVINVGYTLLYKRIYRKVNEIILSKVYGEIKSFDIKFRHSEVLGQKFGWMFDKNKSGGGVLMNPGPHIFSLVNYLFGVPKNISGKIISVYSKGVEDEAKLNFDYKNFTGIVDMSWSVKGYDIASTNMKIVFEKAVIECDGNDIKITLNKKTKIINEDLIEPILPSAFNINPRANGEAYFNEDRLFINSISNKLKNINNIDFAIKMENIIFNSYNNCK